jgi:hypothetical protein
MSSQDTTVSDTLAVVQALKKHLKEPHCKHTIKSILQEGLKSKSAGLVAQTQRQQTQKPPEINLNGNYTK